MSVLQHFEEYQKARVKFVQAVAEAATRPQNIEVMNNAGVMQLLRPLLLDNVSFGLFSYCSFFFYLISALRYQASNKLQLLLWVVLQIIQKI
jgi:hypothetical protein